jgi:hypothetical protein
MRCERREVKSVEKIEDKNKKKCERRRKTDMLSREGRTDARKNHRVKWRENRGKMSEAESSDMRRLVSRQSRKTT